MLYVHVWSWSYGLLWEIMYNFHKCNSDNQKRLGFKELRQGKTNIIFEFIADVIKFAGVFRVANIVFQKSLETLWSA